MASYLARHAAAQTRGGMMWAWLGLIGLWSLLTFALGDSLEVDVLRGIGALAFALCLFFALIIGSVEWLRYMEAWPFIPR